MSDYGGVFKVSDYSTWCFLSVCLQLQWAEATRHYWLNVRCWRDPPCRTRVCRWFKMAARIVERFIVWADWARPRTKSSFQHDWIRRIWNSELKTEKTTLEHPPHSGHTIHHHDPCFFCFLANMPDDILHFGLQTVMISKEFFQIFIYL